MMIRALVVLGMMAWFAPAQEPSCHPVEGDRISTRDLAAALPEFSAAPPGALVAQAPLPGSQRAFHAQELHALAHRFGVALSSDQDICFAWLLHPPDRAAAVVAMQEALQIDGAKIDITEISPTKVPAGRMEFPLTGLGTPSPTGPAAPVLWRGSVVYGDSHRFAIWVRVQIAAPCRKVVAAEALKPGRLIEARQLRTTSAGCFPIHAKESPTAEQVAGMTPLRPIAAGSELRLDLLAGANEVNRGDAVQIEVRSGAAHLALTARALTSGRSGEVISVRNPESNRTFQARVTGKGTALVDAGVPRGI
jgi:flagella basal body P-ring formation protein FlgA